MVRSNELNQLQKLARRWESGDKDAGNAFIEQIEPLVRHYIRRLDYRKTRDNFDDQTQIVLLKIEEAAKSGGLSKIRNLYSWLSTVVQRKVYSSFRDHCAQKRDWRRESQFDEAMSERFKDDRERVDTKLMVDEILESLTAEQRELALQLASGYSQEEIANDLNVHPRTVRRRITALRIPFSKCLSEPSSN